MYKLTVFFYPPMPEQKFDQQGWQKFMGLAEKMPGLQRETVSDVQESVFGHQAFIKIHEFHFNSRQALEEALQSEEGQAAGAWLHQFTGKRFSMLIAEHKEALPQDFHRSNAGS
jgi:uncharacterized protein (TIGR02118 family)